MKIYIDADACPNHIKAILLKASTRTGCPLVFVANQPLNIVRNALVQCVCVQQGFDVADNYIVEKIEKNELAITADIPLAAQILEKGALALNPRGDLYNPDTIRQRLAIRNMMDEVRSSGVHTGGPKAIDKGDIQKFSNALDRYLTKFKK